MTRNPAVLVSVVIPSFNHASFIGQAIDSVLTQEVDLELIVIDDASTDRSPEVVAAESDPRLRFLRHKENRGPAAALNTGITAARGQFVTALGSDDFYLPGTLQRQLAFLDGHPECSAIFGLPRLITEHGTSLNAGYQQFEHPFIGKETKPTTWLRHFFLSGNCLCHPTVMLRRQVHDSAGLYDERLLNLQDFDLWVRMAIRGMAFFVLPVELTARRTFANGQNLSGSGQVSSVLRSQFEMLQVLKAYRALSSADLKRIFCHELELLKQPKDLTAGAILAAIASRSSLGTMQYFALESLYDSLGKNSKQSRQPLFALAGRLDPFRIISGVEAQVRQARGRSELPVSSQDHPSAGDGPR